MVRKRGWARHTFVHTLSHTLTHTHFLSHPLTHSLSHTHTHTHSFAHSLSHTRSHSHTVEATHGLAESWAGRRRVRGWQAWGRKGAGLRDGRAGGCRVDRPEKPNAEGRVVGPCWEKSEPKGPEGQTLLAGTGRTWRRSARRVRPPASGRTRGPERRRVPFGPRCCGPAPGNVDAHPNGVCRHHPGSVSESGRERASGNACVAVMRRSSKEGSYLRLVDFCITQL